jgi:hypothetical protein
MLKGFILLPASILAISWYGVIGLAWVNVAIMPLLMLYWIRSASTVARISMSRLLFPLTGLLFTIVIIWAVHFKYISTMKVNLFAMAKAGGLIIILFALATLLLFYFSRGTRLMVNEVRKFVI